MKICQIALEIAKVGFQILQSPKKLYKNAQGS